MRKTFNLALQDHNEPAASFVVTFYIKDGLYEPEKALRDAVNEFLSSGTEEALKALKEANCYYNWGDALGSVPDEIWEKHGLTRRTSISMSSFVDYNESLFDSSSDDLLVAIKKIVSYYIINGEKDISYWQRGENLVADEIADEIAERNEKLRKLLGMEVIDSDLIKQLIESETDDELIDIYEQIQEEMEDWA